MKSNLSRLAKLLYYLPMKMGATEGFMKYQIEQLEEENKNLKEKLSEITMVADDEKQSIEHILELEEEIRSLELENRAMKVEGEELKMWLREKLPLALLKEYMEKFEGVDLKNV